MSGVIWARPCPVPGRWMLDAIAEELLAQEPEPVFPETPTPIVSGVGSVLQ